MDANTLATAWPKLRLQLKLCPESNLDRYFGDDAFLVTIGGEEVLRSMFARLEAVGWLTITGEALSVTEAGRNKIAADCDPEPVET